MRNVRLDAQFAKFYSCKHDTIQTILTSEQKENVISLMSSFVFGAQVVFKADFSWLETCLASFEVSDANALHYCSFMLHLHHIIAIITSLLSKITYNTFFGVFTLDFLQSKT